MIKSLVDGKSYTADEMTAFIDLHVFRCDEILTRLAAKNGIPTSTQELAK
jgi:hypothetical protein